MRAPVCSTSALSLPRWSQTSCSSTSDYSTSSSVVFPVDPSINDRLIIWQGDISTLEVDAIANITEDNILESNPVSDRIFSAAGPQLKEEILARGYGEGATGRVYVTGAARLPCTRVLHTTLAHHSHIQTALVQCYRSVLEKCVELNIKSLALAMAPSSSRTYTNEIAAHAALYSIRAHLSRCQLPTVVCVCVSQCQSVADNAAHAHFPAHDRIRIIHNPRTEHGMCHCFLLPN